MTYTLSRDYGRLFDLICAGHVLVGWVDYGSMRDIVKIQRRKAFDVFIGVRGTCYTDLGEWDESKGTERDVFADRCSSVNLEWIEPGLSRAAVADALAALLADLLHQAQITISDSMAFGCEFSANKLSATITALGLPPAAAEKEKL